MNIFTTTTINITTTRSLRIRCQAASPQTKKVIVVGSGWAGLGAAKHLAEQHDVSVTLLDAQSTPGGVSAGWRTPQGRPVEAGIKGFWYAYPNISDLVDNQLDLEESPFTDYLTSGFWAPDGLITEAPVFSKQTRLPTIIGQFVATHPLFYRLSLADRLTIIPWLYHVLNFNSDPETYEKYDQMTAREMFRMSGVTEAAYEYFLKPTLQVGLFAPPEELSAAVTCECLYFYSLAHMYDFDVRWCKGSISEKIFEPLVRKIELAGGSVLGKRFVTGLDLDDDGTCRVIAKNIDACREEVYEADAIIFALSIKGMQKLVSSNPLLASLKEFRNIMNLRSIDCIATRLWFDRKVPCKFPANVLAGFEEDVGATYFDLNQLQTKECTNEPGSVIAADFYGANSLMPLSDEEIIKKVHKNIASCDPGFASATVIDSSVLRFPQAVSHFAPGSHRHRPYQRSSFSNVFLAGDWVKGVDHGANGLSQERAYVTGLMAANYALEYLNVGQPARILPIEPDEPHIVIMKEANKQIKTAVASTGVRLPPFL